MHCKMGSSACVHMLENACLVKKKTVQVAVGGGSTATHVCTLVYTLVGARKTQPAQGSTRPRSGEGLCPRASCNSLLHPAPTSAQDGLDPQQLALVVLFLSSNSTKTYLHLLWTFPATCVGCVFLAPTTYIAYVLLRTHDLLPKCFISVPFTLYLINITCNISINLPYILYKSAGIYT